MDGIGNRRERLVLTLPMAPASLRPMRPLDGTFTILGNRVPRVVGLLIGLTFLASIGAAVGARNGFPALLAQGILAPDFVWAGQLWRLVTWVFLELGGQPPGLNLFFGSLLLWWVGRDLYYAWGATRLLGTYLGIAVAAGAATCLVARLVWPGLMGADYMGMWPVVDALIIAWATIHPSREILVFLVLPARGRTLILITLGMTLLFGLINGIAGFVPHFLAEGLMLAHLNPPLSLQKLWHQTRMRRSQRRSPKLRAVDRDDPPRWLH